MKKISKKKSVELILSEMKKGNVNPVSVLGKIGKNWEISQSSFYRHWKEASNTFEKYQNSIQKQLLEEDTALAKERLKKAILTREERMEIATKLAKGEAWKVNGSLTIPSASDRLKALDYLSKLDGDYAPKKHQHSIDDVKMQRVKVVIKEKS